MMTSNYLEYHKKMINKQVLIVDKENDNWTGFVRKIKNDSYFLVERESDNKISESTFVILYSIGL